LPTTCSGSSGSAIAPASASTFTSTLVCPSAFANDLAGRISVTWASSVVNTAVLLPSLPSLTVKVPGVGFWFVAASSGGGFTHR